MKHFGLIGNKITYAKSPEIHQYMAKHLKLDFTYDLLDVPESQLGMLIKQLKSGLYDGYNITQPYKEIIIPFIDELTSKAQKIGAVNTVYFKNNRVVGDNTDYDGFFGLLERHKIKTEGKHVFILGTGGAAKACYHVLIDQGAKVTFVTRDALKTNKETISFRDIKLEEVDLYIQATPVGTYPQLQESVLRKEMVETKQVIDLVYNPLETQIMKYAKKSVNGIDMLMLQALKSLSIWLEQDIILTPALHKKLKDVIVNE